MRHAKIKNNKEISVLLFGNCLVQWFSKFFSHSSLTNPTLSIPPQQKSQMIIAKISHYLLWRNNRWLWTKQTLSKYQSLHLKKLLPASYCNCCLTGAWFSWLWSWLVIAASPSHRQTLRRLKNGSPQGYVLAPLLLNICISELPTTVSRK